ncbi:MAG: ribose 5-phosphate isomerase B [Candidatus Omnitrophica bacterium]|nr:ribose 5-phosphate isomerase B [Candidatus Omnitrophota bacterium]
MKKETIILGADHAGFDVKEFIKKELLRMNYPIKDVGTYNKTVRVDYPDYAERVAVEVRMHKRRKGMLTCGTGIGASIAANKIPGIRAALVQNLRDAKLSREHNNANILVVGGRPFNKEKVRKIIHLWLKSKFKGGRHKRRLEKISRLEKKYCNKMVKPHISGKG